MEGNRFVFIEDKDDVYKAMRVLSSIDDNLSVCDMRDEEKTAVVKQDKTFPICSLEELENPPNDLILLSIVHRPAILHTLRSRFFVNEIYTNVGAILVSVNPFKKIVGLYDTSVMNEFSQALSSERPHVFAVSQGAYDGLKRGKSQSLIISGESGAGKTEATKQALSYLAHVAGSTSGVQEKILLSSPILEAWGNAKTIRNDNSSRFGKFIEIWFGKYSDIIGASTTTYLLEKSRVVFQERDERNYHVFYQLLFGAPAQLLAELRLSEYAQNPNLLALVNQSGCIQVPSIDDAADYGDVQRALANLNFSPEEISMMNRIVGGVLHLGNVELLCPTETDACSVSSTTAVSLENAVDLWGVNADFMRQALLLKTVKSGGKRNSFVLTPLTHSAAIENKNALTKEIYNRCFDWIVSKINDAMGTTTFSVGSIGVLDIFGFEIFKKNSLEQLCINLANEALQQHFNYHIFQAEMDFYRSEDIVIPRLDYSDNQDVLDLIMKRSTGLIAILDEEGVVPRGSVEGFLSKLVKAHSAHPRFINKQRTKEFVVRHYAGEVTYDPTHFLSKNKDTISQDIIDLMKESVLPFIAELFKDSSATSGGSAAAGGGGTANTNKQTVGKKFSIQLEALMSTLNKTEPRYIRCVKPNQAKLRDEFDSATTNEQLTYSGIFEAVIIMQSGFPYRFSLKDFLARYHMLVLDAEIRVQELFPSASSVNTLRKRCAALVHHAAIIHAEELLNSCHVGKTTVLYKSPQNRCLEKLRYSVLLKYSLKIQRFYRGAIIRLLIGQLKDAVASCKHFINLADAENIAQNAFKLKQSLNRLTRISQSNNIVEFPIQRVAEEYSVALRTEQINEEKIRSLLRNTSVAHIVSNIDALVAANNAIKSISFSAILDGAEIKRVWSSNAGLVESDVIIRKFKASVDLRLQLKQAVLEKNDLVLEELLVKVGELRSQKELISGYCTDDEKLGAKITHDARLAFNDFLNQSIAMMVDGQLHVSRNAENNALKVDVSSKEITKLLEAHNRHVASRSAASTTTRVKLLTKLFQFIQSLRCAAENQEWVHLRSALQHTKLVGNQIGLKYACWSQGIFPTVADEDYDPHFEYIYLPAEIEERILSEIQGYRICVVQFLVLPVIEDKMRGSPSHAQEFSMEIPASYLTALQESVDLLAPHAIALQIDPFLKQLHDVIDVKETLWRGLFEGNVLIIKNSLSSLKSISGSDPDYEYGHRHLAMYSLRDAISHALSHDGPQGEPGSLSFDTISSRSLEHGITEAQKLGVNNSLWNTLLEMCGKVQQLRVLISNGQEQEALMFASRVSEVSSYLNQSFISSKMQNLGAKSSSFLLVSITKLAAEEIHNCKCELLHMKALDAIVNSIRTTRIDGEVGFINLKQADAVKTKRIVEQNKKDLIMCPSTIRFLADLDVLCDLRKLALDGDWATLELQIQAFVSASNGFEDVHVSMKDELLVLRGEILDRDIRRLLTESISTCRHHIPEGSDQDLILFDREMVADLRKSIDRVESNPFKSYESLYLLTAASVLFAIANAVNSNYWEPPALFCSRMTLSELTESFAKDDDSADFLHFLNSINVLRNFDALEAINSYDPSVISTPSLPASLSVAEVLVYSSYVGIHPLAAAEINEIRKISFDRRCRASLLLAAGTGRISGSIHSGFDTTTANIPSLIRALKFVKLHRKYWSPVVENWVQVCNELLNVRLAVLSAGGEPSKGNAGVYPEKKIELESYLNLEDLNGLIERTIHGFPLSEIKFVVDNVNDILLIKSISDALMQGRPQYVMGKFSSQFVEFENLAGLLQKSKKLRQRSDKLDRLMFYADLCVRLRRALLSHLWDDAGPSSQDNSSSAAEKSVSKMKSTERNPGVKQCVQEYRLANKFFSLNKMEGIPPKCLHDEFESMEREFEKRIILQDFSAVLQAGAITGSPFALNFREISVTSLEAQVKRVKEWEKATGVFDIDMETLCKACSEILKIRTQVKQIHASYKRNFILNVRSTNAKDILASSFIDDCIDSALSNTARINVTPYPMLLEWEPVERVVSSVEVAATIRSSKQEIDLVSAETFSRNFIAKVIKIFLSIGVDKLSFDRANQAIMDLSSACQSHAIRAQEVDAKSKKNFYSSPVLRMMHESAIIFVHLLRAEMLNIYDPPSRNWRISDGENTPRMPQLVESLSSGRYSVQALIRTCLPLELHPRLVKYLNHIIFDVEDRVSEMELNLQLTASSIHAGTVSELDVNSISVTDFIATIERIDNVGIHREELRILHESSIIICNLRVAVKSLDFANGIEILIGMLNDYGEGSCNELPQVLRAINAGRFSVHASARMEFVRLAFIVCDGYWRILATQALLSGQVTGSRGLLHVAEIGWADIDTVLSCAKYHLELSPESLILQDICFVVRNLRARVVGSLEDNEAKRQLLSIEISPTIEVPSTAIVTASSGRKVKLEKISMVNEEFISNCINRAVLNINSISTANNVSLDLHYPSWFAAIESVVELLKTTEVFDRDVRDSIFQEISLISAQLELLKATSLLYRAADMQSIWFTEFGLETRDQFKPIIAAAIDAAMAQNWDFNLLPERWSRGLLDTLLSIMLLHDQIKFTGQAAVQPGTATFESITPYIQGFLTNYRQLCGADNLLSRVPQNLVVLSHHLQQALQEHSNIDKLKQILNSDQLICEVNYGGRFVLVVSHKFPVTGLNFFNSEYGPYALKLNLHIDKIKVATFLGRQLQRLTKMYVKMRMAVKVGKFNEALALSKVIVELDEKILTPNLKDCEHVRIYSEFLICKRSLEQGISSCILPPFAGWIEYGAMPTFGLALIDAPLAEAIDKTMRTLPGFAKQYPELATLVDVGLLFLKLISAIRTNSFKSLSIVASRHHDSASLTTQEAIPQPTVKTKGRRQSMMATGIQNKSVDGSRMTPAGPSDNSSISIIDSLATKYYGSFAQLRSAMMFHSGETVEHVVNMMKALLQGHRTILDTNIRNFVIQITNQAETELKFADLEALASKIIKECKLHGTPGNLQVPPNAIEKLTALCDRFAFEEKLVRACYPLTRAYQSVRIMILILQSLRDENIEDTGKYLCLMSYMGSRKSIINEAKCEDYIYQETFDEQSLLSLDEVSFKSGIKSRVRRLRTVSSGREMRLTAKSKSTAEIVDETIEASQEAESNPALQFIDELAQEVLSCPVAEVFRLREEYFDDLCLLEQNFTIECHYSDFVQALDTGHAVGEPGELDVSGVEFDHFFPMLHSLHHYGLVSTVSPVGTLFHDAIEAIYFLRKAQKDEDICMLRSAIEKIAVVEETEQSYIHQHAERAFEAATNSSDERLLQRARSLGIVDLNILQDPTARKSPTSTRQFISLAAAEIELARLDLGQKELIAAFRKGINEAVVTMSLISVVSLVQSKVVEMELATTELAKSIEMSNKYPPTCRKAIDMFNSAQALLYIRQALNGRKWSSLRAYIETLDKSAILNSCQEEIIISLRLATIANVMEKSIRAYKIGSIYGNPGKIEGFESIDCSIVEDALRAYNDIEDSWKTIDIMLHYYSCVVLHAIRKHFMRSEWFVVCDIASVALDKIRISSKPLSAFAEAEIKLALEHSSYMISYETLSHAFQEGRLKGEIGAIDTSELSVIVLDHALTISRNLGCPLADIAVMETSAEILRDIRQAELLGYWISNNNAESVESYSIERAIVSTSYSIMPTDVFGHAFDVTPSNIARRMSLEQNREYQSPLQKLIAFSAHEPEASDNDKFEDSGHDLLPAKRRESFDKSTHLVNQGIVKAVTFDPDLSTLFQTSRSKHSTKFRTVKEIIAHAREVQNTMELSSLILDELELAANEVTYREVSFGLLKAIKTPGIVGVPGALDLSRVRTHELVEAVAAAEASGDLSKKNSCRWLLRDAKLLLSLRQKTIQRNYKLLSILFRDAQRQNSPEYVDPTDKQPGLPIILPVWQEIQLVHGDVTFQMCLAQFAQEMQNLHEYSASGSRNSRRVVAMLRVLVTTMRAAALHPCPEFEHLVEAQSVALELRVFHNFEPDKNPADIIHRVGEAKRRDLLAGNVSYMTLLMSDISNMSNVVDKQLHVDLLQNELINGQLYLMRPLGRIDTSVLDVDRLQAALDSATPLVSVMGSPAEIKLLRLCEAIVEIRNAIKSGNWSEVGVIMDNPSNADILKSSLVHDEIDRLKCEIENHDACLLLERTMMMGRYMNVVNLARLECKPRGSVIDRNQMSAGERRRVSQLPGSFFGGLESLERAMLTGNIVNRRSEVLNSYLRAASLIYRIRDKMAHGQWEDLKTMLHDETKFSSLPQFAVEELRAVKAGMAYRNTMFGVCNALINGCVTGVPGNVIISTVDAYALQQSLNEASALDMTDTATAIMFDVGTCICRLRNAVKEGRWFPVGQSSAKESSPGRPRSPIITIIEPDKPVVGAATTDFAPIKSKSGGLASLMFGDVDLESEDQPADIEPETLALPPARATGNGNNIPFSNSSVFAPPVRSQRSNSVENQQVLRNSVNSKASVQEIVQEFLSKKEYNYSTLREALSIGDADEASIQEDSDADWMMQQWEALCQVQKEVELISGELKERKVSSSIVFALENIPDMVKNFTGTAIGSKRTSKEHAGWTADRLELQGQDVSGPEENASDDLDPLKIQLLEMALDECTVPSLSAGADEISRETERLITTAKLILRFRLSLLNFDLEEFKVLLDEAKTLQIQGQLSSHYGLHELSVYRSSSMAITIAKNKLIQNMKSGCVSGRLDAVVVEKVDTAVLIYWLNACLALSHSTRGIVNDLEQHIEEANRLIKLRELVKSGDWTSIREMLKSIPSQSKDLAGNISTDEVEHIRMISKYRDASAEIVELLADQVAFLDSTLITKIPPLETCLENVKSVLEYKSPLLPSDQQPLLQDQEFRESFRIGSCVLQLWKAIRNNYWNIDAISSSNLNEVDRPKDKLLCRLFDSIRQHEVARKFDGVHAQLQLLGFEKTASSLPHRNIRSSISSSLVKLRSPTGGDFATFDNGSNHLAIEGLVGNDNSFISKKSIPSVITAPVPAAPAQKTRRVSVMMGPDAGAKGIGEGIPISKQPPTPATKKKSGINNDSCSQTLPSSRRRSVSEVASRIMIQHQFSSVTIDPATSASAILCREDWSAFPRNIRRLFNVARDRMIDYIIRARLMYGCKDGALSLDEQGDLVVPAMCTDLIDIVLTDVSRIQSFCVRIGINFKFSSTTEQWFAAAKSLMKCRRAFMFDNIEAVILELLQQGYLGRFRKIDFDKRPGHEEFDLIERFLFEHMAEKAIRKAAEFLLSVPAITNVEYHHRYIDALKAVSVLPQSMRSPTEYYRNLMTFATELRRAVSATATGDLGRLMTNEEKLFNLLENDEFALRDIDSSMRMLFTVFKASIVGTKRFKSSTMKTPKSKKPSKTGENSSNASNPYALDLKKKLLTQRSGNKSLASLLFGSAQGALEAQDDEDEASSQALSQIMNDEVELEPDDDDDQQEYGRVGTIRHFDPFCSPQDIANDTEDFVKRRMRKSVECPGIIFVQSCELSDLGYSTFDSTASTALNSVQTTIANISSIFEKFIREINNYKAPKTASIQSSALEGDDRRSYKTLRSMLAKDADALSDLQAMYHSPMIDEVVVDQLRSLVQGFSQLFIIQETLWAIAANTVLQCMLVKSPQPVQQTTKFVSVKTHVAMPACVIEFFGSLRVHGISEFGYNAKRQERIAKKSLRPVDLLSLSVFLGKAVHLQGHIEMSTMGGTNHRTIAQQLFEYAEKCSVIADRSVEADDGSTPSNEVKIDPPSTVSTHSSQLLEKTSEFKEQLSGAPMSVAMRAKSICQQIQRLLS